MSNRVTVRNVTGIAVDSLRLDVADQTFRLGPLASGASRAVSFDPSRDAHLTLCVDRGRGEACADYGYVTPGLWQAHVFSVLPDRVAYTFH